MKGIFLLLGTNIGDRQANLEKAIELLQEAETVVVDYSSVYETAPWGNTNQDWFLNMVIRIETMHSPEALLQVCQEVETLFGRKRAEKWGSRIIDIDILYFDNVDEDLPNLKIPHPGIAVRRFTLLPLVEIAAKEVHPILKLPQEAILNICPDELECKKTSIELNI